uniref:PEHE domain-containing protein n=1 Tax=Electrophorus electricus TaxID=8005 RepID=A0A4W4FV68_ELEEL
MAAMAPALTDAPAEAHRIRFKLAPPSSTLSPSSVEGNGGTSHILVSSNGTVKRKTPEEHASCKREDPACVEATPTPLGKRQPLVTSYLCSDVTSVPSPKESLRLQGVLLQTHGFLPRKHQTLEQFKSIMSVGSVSGPCPSPSLQGTPVNGMAKKLTKPGPDRDNIVTLNGGKHAGQDSLHQAHAVTSHGNLMGNGPLRDGIEQHRCPRGVSQDCSNSQEPPTSFPMPSAPSELDEEKPSERLPLLSKDPLASPPATSQYPLDSVGVELRDRAQQSQSRQGEIEGRLRRLRKRLQVVQAKQVERHVQQQLGGLLNSTLGPQDGSWPRGCYGADALALQEKDRLGRFLKGGTVPAELERLALCCTTNLRSAEGAFDSDATESSSGGETDVEEDELTRVDIEPGYKVEWYALNRAAIISHWNWLQAHVSDLEYRIRQQTDIYRQIRANKVCNNHVHDAAGTEGCVLSHEISMDTSLRKGFRPVRQVNGVINSLRAGSSDSPTPEEHLSSVPAPPSTPGSSCVAARTRPLLSCKRRRLLQPCSITNLNRKVAANKTISTISSSAWLRITTADAQYQLPLLDRLAQFDPCVHPILSFADDVGMSLHLQRVLKCHWQSRPLEQIKPIKKLSLKHRLSLSSRLPDSSSSSSSKEKHKLANSLLSTVRKSSYHHGTAKAVQLSDCRPPVYNPPSPSPSLPSFNNPSHSPLVRQLSSFESPTPCSFNNTTPVTVYQPIRRRRGESSFDINNIVIPMSVAATTRVEKLQYKEIITPSWREVDIIAKKISEEDDSIEDLSDAVFAQLHLPYEEQERSRWSWTASAVAKRRGSRSYKSVDGRTTPLLGGTNPSTPQPSSPDTAHFHLLQDYSSAASPSSPVSPELLMLPGLHTPAPRDSHRLLSNEDTRCSTPDTVYDEMPVQPWERRYFPLVVDPVLEQEDQSSPASERPCRAMRRVSGCKTGSSKSESDAGPPSPLAEDSSKQKATPHKHAQR